MKLVTRLVLLAALAGLGYWLWTLFFPNPEKVVLARVARLAAVATIKPSDGALTRANKVSDLIGFFATDAEIHFETMGQSVRTLTGREEIREVAAGGFASANSLSVQFQDATARVGADQRTAVVNCTARVSAGDKTDFGLQELRISLQWVDSHWLVTRMETVRTLQ